MTATSLAAFSAGDFAAVSAAFVAAGYRVTQPATGLLQILSSPAAAGLVLSVGVHGDETAPIEIVAALLQALAREPQQLAVNLLLVIGNPVAIRQAKRFIEIDLNRLFGAPTAVSRGTVEADRAACIMAASQDFFAEIDGPRWHLDLHTTIRPSRYSAFAIIPAAASAVQKQVLINFLADAAIDAVILHRQPSTTFRAFTAQQFGAISATLELGQVGKLGENLLQPFTAASAALAKLLRHGPSSLVAAIADSRPLLFSVEQELVRRSSSFLLQAEGALENFMALPANSVVATDGVLISRIGTVDAYLVFPNPNVQIGQRAGLIVTPVTSID